MHPGCVEIDADVGVQTGRQTGGGMSSRQSEGMGVAKGAVMVVTMQQEPELSVCLPPNQTSGTTQRTPRLGPTVGLFGRG